LRIWNDFSLLSKFEKIRREKRRARKKGEAKQREFAEDILSPYKILQNILQAWSIIPILVGCLQNS